MAALGEITWGMTVASTRLWAPEKCPRATCRGQGQAGWGAPGWSWGAAAPGSGTRGGDFMCQGCRAGLEPTGSRAGASWEASHQEMSYRDHELLQTHGFTKSTPQPSLTIHSSVYILTNTGSFLIQTLTNPVLKHSRFCGNAGVQ